MQGNREAGLNTSAVYFVYLLSEILLAWFALSFLWILIKCKSANCRACIFTNWVFPIPPTPRSQILFALPCLSLMLVPSQAAWYQNDILRAFNVYFVPSTLPDTLSYFSLTTVQGRYYISYCRWERQGLSEWDLPSWQWPAWDQDLRSLLEALL